MAEDKFKDKHSMKDDVNVDLTVISKALMNKTSNSNGGRLTLNSNNNNNDNTHDKNKSFDGFGDFGPMVNNSNGDGLNNGKAIDNFANFDAFSTANDLDLFGNANFPDGIGLSSTQIDCTKNGTNDVTSSAMAKDRFLSNYDTMSTKQNLLTNQTNNNDHFNNVTINDYFDAKFDSFMTTDKTADANSNTQSTIQHSFGLNNDDGFADFSNANVFNATNNSNNDINARFDTAFQPCNSFTNNNTITKTCTTLGQTKSTWDCDDMKNNTEIIPSKFQQDYSKMDQFDADLQEVLKRSLVDH